MEFELELAQTVQKALLPQEVPAIPGLDLAVFSRPAQIVAGDYFDFFHFRDGAHGLAIGDVAGHGMSSSLLMASLQTALRTLIPTTDVPAEVLRHVNRFFCHNINFTTFASLFLGRYDHVTRTLEYCNAGQNPPLHLRQRAATRDAITWLQTTGPAIGLIEDFRITAETLTLEPGDILLLYTDGITEAMNDRGEEFGRERLAALVHQESALSAKALVRTLRDALQTFTHGLPLADDTTIIVCKSDS